MITFEYDGKEYNLTFTPATIKKMERDGFDFAKMSDRAITTLIDLPRYAFEARHADVCEDKRDEIIGELAETDGNTNGFMEAVIEELNSALKSITSRKGNVMWRVK